MPKQAHNIAIFILMAYMLTVFHTPLSHFVHMVEHVVEATDFHHHHDHIDENLADETPFKEQIDSHHHKTISLFELAFGEDEGHGDESKETAQFNLEKHIIARITDLQPIYPELILLQNGFENFPLLSRHLNLQTPPPRRI